VVYVGRHDGVFLPLEAGGEIEVLKHQKVKVPDSMLEALLEQPENWELPKKDEAKITEKPAKTESKKGEAKDEAADAAEGDS